MLSFLPFKILLEKEYRIYFEHNRIHVPVIMMLLVLTPLTADLISLFLLLHSNPLCCH